MQVISGAPLIDISGSSSGVFSSPSQSFASKFRERVKAAKKVHKRPSAISDPTASPLKTEQLNNARAVAERLKARADGKETGGDPREREIRAVIKEKLKQRGPEPPTPLMLEQKAVNALKEQRMRARADGGGDGGDANAKKLRWIAAKRLKQQQREAELELIGGKSAARVAIIGAGPAGLWLAVLIARKHASFANGPNGPVITKGVNAPTIDVFEKRQPAPSSSKADAESSSRAHGGRSIVLAITQQTNDLLNRNILGATIDRTGGHAFAPTTRIGNIEKILAAEFEKYCAAGFGSLKYGAEGDVGDPDELHSKAKGGYDVVVVATGRRNATDEWRAERDMKTIVEGTAACLVLEFRGAKPSSDGWGSVVASASRAISPGQIFIRPGSDEGRGWVWLVGLPEQLSNAIRDGVQMAREAQKRQQQAQQPEHASLVAALEAVLGRGEGGEQSGRELLPGEASAIEGLKTLDASLKAAGAKAGWTEGSYWRSTSVIHKPTQEGLDNGPTILIGDACCGRPFWLGSTLNGHFADVAMLAQAPCWNAWDWQKEGDQPLRGYLDRMRTLRKCGTGQGGPTFKRPTAEENAKLNFELARRGSKVVAAGPITADLIKSAQAAEMRNKARAVGVSRASLGSSSSMIKVNSRESSR